jgi:SAM-dependent methyltransferase
VHLVDVVLEHVRAAAGHGLVTAEVGDARRLTQADASVDAVLLLGPLYHLVGRGERIAALAEARRVLRPGGVLLAAAIGRFMAVLDWAQSGGLTAYVAAKLVPVLTIGVHDPTLGFTDAFFHTAAQLQKEVLEAGFADVRVLGIEGPAWTIVDAPGDDADARLDSALRCAQLTENFAEVVDASAHLMALGTAPSIKGPAAGGGEPPVPQVLVAVPQRGRPPPSRCPAEGPPCASSRLPASGSAWERASEGKRYG